MLRESTRSGWVLVLALLSTAGCGAATVTDEGSVSALPQLVEVVRIGCDECDGVRQFDPRGVAIGADGRVYELDAHEPHVRVFDLAGDDVGAYGRPGQGPGEIGMPVAVFPAAAGGAIVYDLPGLHRYGPEGEHLGTMTWAMRVPSSFDYLPAARVLLKIDFVPQAPARPLGGGKALTRWVLQGDQLEPEVLIADEALPRDSRDGSRAAPLAVAVRGDGGYVLGDAWEYRILRYTSEGELVAEFGRDVPRTPMSDEQATIRRELAKRRGSAAEFVPEQDHFRPFDLEFDGRDRLWVLTTHGESGTSLFDVFDPQGEFLGEISVPGFISSQYPFFALTGDHIAAIIENQAGARTMQVWRIEG